MQNSLKNRATVQLISKIFIHMCGMPCWLCVRPSTGVRGDPVLLQPAAHVLHRLLQAVLLQNDVPHLQRTLRQLLSRNHLHVQVLCLGLAAGLN